MVICVESYLGPYDGGEGVKLEDQVLVTESGIEVLSSLAFMEDWL
jgi:Xaa-Pro aminopeptidase